MKTELLDLLRCPQSGQILEVVECIYKDGEIQSGWLVSQDGLHRYPIRDCVPRFVPESNYSDSFGLQWNKFGKTQLDSYSGHPISAKRFWDETGWKKEDIAGQWVLDAGCGAGRFSEIALSAGAKVVAIDYSNSVDACHENLKKYANLHVVQGDIYSLPFARGCFHFVFSLGVLQHTPDVALAFAALPSMLSGGGRLCVDFYEKSWKSRLLPKYWLRPLTKRISKMKLLLMLEHIVPILLPISRLVGHFPIFGNPLKKMLPVANYYGSLQLDDTQQLEWSILDTFDWFSPEFDNPQKSKTVQLWIENAEMENIEVLHEHHLVGRGTKPRISLIDGADNLN
jgi:SAM-dependent methyltransferase